MVIDGNRLRFKFSGWRACFAVKVLRSRVKELLAKEFRVPGRGVVTERQKAWMRIFGLVFENVETGRSLR